MDELLQHCLRELSFDGDLGCNVSRLRDFVVDFYTHGRNTTAQNVDDSFCAFVWSLVVQQPTVIVGTVPEGVTAEVWIAPQNSAKRKAKAKGEEHIEVAPPKLDIVPDAKNRSLDDLKAQYGNNLRIAADPEATYAAITGTHIRFPKMSPMVYSALQIITRGRENGVSVVELGQTSKYDQKTCFYLVRQLTELDLVVKVRRGGVGTHFCIHKYFFDRSEFWKGIRDEETRATADVGTPSSAPIPTTSVPPFEEDPPPEHPDLDFPPIDARHLSSQPLVKARIIKLLKASKNLMHASHNMLIAIGFANPTKTDRRFFASHTRELLEQRVIESVFVPGKVKRSPNAAGVKCFRLVSADSGPAPQVVQPDDDALADDRSCIKMNLTIHKQIISLIEESGTTGMTLNELAAALCQFDKRTIELLLARVEKFPPPAHLSDLGIAGLMETSGRERRNRYFTIASYQALVAREKLDKDSAGYADVDLSNVGEFFPFTREAFYTDYAALTNHQDRDAKYVKDASDKPSKNKKNKNKTLKNPVMADGTVKKGRPRKEPPAGEEWKPRKRKRQEDGEAGPSQPKKAPLAKKRRLNAKQAHPEPTDDAVVPEPTALDADPDADAVPPAPPKKKGRPPKNNPSAGAEDVPAVTKKRGRPKKAPRPPDAPSRGRPKKSEEPDDGTVVPEPTALDAHPGADAAPPAPPNKRGRPSKNPPAAGAEAVPAGPKTRSRRKEVEPDAQQKPTDGEQAGAGESELEGVLSPKKRSRQAQSEPAAESVEETSDEQQKVADDDEQKGTGESESEDAQPPKKRVRRAHSEAPNDHVERSGTKEPDYEDALNLQSPLSTPELPLIPPVAVLPPVQSSPPASTAQSSPLTELQSLDELADENTVDTISDDAAVSQLGDAMLVDQQESGALESPVDPTLAAIDSEFPSVLVPAATDSILLSISEAPPPSEVPRSSSFAVDVPAVRPKVNVSSLRRENELYRVLEELGGIINTQTKEPYDAHLLLLATLTKAGEPTSAPPGTRLDRRTANAAFNNLELRGRVKQLKTTVSSLTGLTRPANIVYFPDIEESRIKAYITELGRNSVHIPPVPAGIVLHENTEYGSKAVARKPPQGPVQLLLQAGNSDPERAEKLFSYDDKTVQEVLLTERTTLGQLYGFIPGKLSRVRKLHLYTLDAMENNVPCANIVSHEKRIVCFAFFHDDIPIELYCAIVAALENSPEMVRLLSTDEGRKLPARNIPPPLHTLFQIGRARGRGRLLELLEILRALGLATPLGRCEEGIPLITCAPNGSYPTSYKEFTSENWSKEATVSAPEYWHFTSNAPVYHWAVSEQDPPFLKNMPLVSCAEVTEYWKFLQEACCNTGIPSFEVLDGPPPDLKLAVKKATTLRRRVSWLDGYSFTWHQSHYLNRYVNGFQGQPPLRLDSAEADKTLQRLCEIVSAPEGAVRDFFQKAELARLHAIEKANRKAEQKLLNQARDEETRVALAQKAAEARADREVRWEDLVKRVHPHPLSDAASIRLRRIRTLFLQATGTQTEKWARDIGQALHEADMATAVSALSAKQFGWPLKSASAALPSSPSVPITPLPAPPVVANPPEKSIKSLIDAQGPLVSERPRPKAKSRRRNNALESEAPAPSVEKQSTPLDDNQPAPSGETQSKPPVENAPPVQNSGPRTRFHWNKDYDELAKDAFAIIHSRCRTRGKLDYGAIQQVFPGVTRNNVRTHVKQLKESSAAMATYMSRLEDHWHELWVKYRGTALLPDDDPRSLTFDLIAHIEFLRKHVDKNALRVGFLEMKEKEKNTIPRSVEELLDQFDVVETHTSGSAWDFMWNGLVDEGREKRALRQAFTTRPDDLVLGTENSSDESLLAESVLKMAMGTAPENYDPEVASWVLHNIGEETVNPAHKNLLSRGVLSRRFKNPNSQPGRMLKISEGNQNAIGGSIPRDTFQDAAALEDISTDDQSWREWPLLSTDGDTAALIQLVSDNKVDFKIDTAQAQAARPAIDWNSKRADDDDIETAIFVRFHDISIPHTPSPAPAPPLSLMDVETVAEHGTTESGSSACCKRVNENSLIDCAACLEEEWGALYASLGSKDRDQFQLILDTVMGSGAKGITKTDLLTQTRLPEDVALAAIGSITECAVPLIFWAGYQSLVLVASSYLPAWSVLLSMEPQMRIFPRRWLDMTGTKVMDVWEAATRAVMGVLVLHPGVTQTQLRWRLRSVYDRQEVNEVLRYLSDAEFVSVRGGTLPAEDEESVLLFVGARHWYQV
ncbi:hypothetical protein C8R45DRAFT_1066116 [Mycena sanguinolenta]|nr:hypothetical protein C8R45DRAFT_1066116 [Mycena sanguinolenta]